MKALIRNNEIITESYKIKGIDWETGAPLTNECWDGGPYTLVEEYVSPTYNENGEIVTDSAKSLEIAELKARLAALEKDL